MAVNVEIKAKINNFDEFLHLASTIADDPSVVLEQVDTYYKVQNGRLKLRQMQNQDAELIFYDRPDTEGPKLSNYSKQEFKNHKEIDGLKNAANLAKQSNVDSPLNVADEDCASNINIEDPVSVIDQESEPSNEGGGSSQILNNDIDKMKKGHGHKTGFQDEWKKQFPWLRCEHDPLWSASLLHKNPEAIQNVHKRYLENGADILTTASYQASIKGFQKCLGLTVESSEQLIKLSVTLAKRAKEDFGNLSKGGKEILIAGSVGSYGAALADGSEYSGNFCDRLTHEELMEWHRPRIQCLVDAGVDLLAFETIPALKEAEALVTLLSDFPDAKAWLSFSCQSAHKTCHGEDIGTASQACAKLTSPIQLVAVGINCCSPEFCESLLQHIKDVLPDYPLIVYPNSGELWDTQIGWSGGIVKPNSAYLKSWTDANAKIIGGCCRTKPEDIADIYEFVASRKGNENR